MPSFMKFAAAALAVATPLVSAQTYSDCNPMKATCPANKGSTESSLHFDFTQASALDQFKVSGGSVPTGSDGAEFTINKEGDAPTIVSDFYFFYGELSIEMKTSPGQGIVSSAFLQSDDLDEVDWEGVGGKDNTIETNYFGKGDTTTYDRETWVGVSSPHDSFHTYTIQWSKDTVNWLIDGANVRTLNYKDAQGGDRFPQTPMNIHIGIWAGGAPTNGQGTIDWAGGLTDYSNGPYSMYVKSISVKNANPAESYTWSDQSGSAESIQFTGSKAVSSRSTTTSDAATSPSTEATSSESPSATESPSTTTESPSTTTESPSTTTESPSTTAETTSSAATTLATKTSSSSSAESTAETTAASSSGAVSASSSGVSPSGSSRPSSGSSSESGSASGSGSGSSTETGSSSTSPSGSGSSTSASASASPSFNAAASVAASYLAPVSLLGLLTAMLQL